ncbi:hypothetical protein V1264_017924 [Littorina saxatilis]|uniref:Uncharacterized protein n=1 Tax=Littorina saxatilis TaxID=31220 RepID=A0AAN9GFP1_9CAEN
MDIQNGDQISITCNELFRSFSYAWYITTPSTGETNRIMGTCPSCLHAPCPPCDIDDTAHNITRAPNNRGTDMSTIVFVTTQNATIRCTRSGDLISGVTCRLNVIGGPRTIAPSSSSTTESTETTSPGDTDPSDRARQSTVSATQKKYKSPVSLPLMYVQEKVI